MIRLGQVPAGMTVRLVEDGPLVGAVTFDAAVPAAPVLHFSDGTTWEATLSGDSLTASWLKTAAEVAELIDAHPHRVSLRSPIDGQVYASGSVRVERVPGGTPSTVVPSGGSITVDTVDGVVQVTYNVSGGGGGGAVDSVNGQTGVVVLDADDVGAAADNDPRLSNARTPTTHAASHASGGSDPVTPASIGAATPSQVSSGDLATLAAAQSHAQGLVDALTAASPATLDTLAEIAAALGEDPNFAATMTNALAARVRFDAAQSLTVGEQAQARSNIGAGTSSFSGDYGDLDNKPTLGDAAAKNTGTTAGTVAAGDDSRITGAVQKSANLSDLANAGTARTNLGLGTAATTAATDYATAAQGVKADSALQVGTPVPIVALSGAQTTGATHAGKDLHITASSGVDLTVQTAPAGSVIQVRQSGAGALTCVGDGVTLTAMPGMTLVSGGLGARFAIVYTSTTTADVLGWMVPA